MIGYVISLIILISSYTAALFFLFKRDRDIPYLEYLLPITVMVLYLANVIWIYHDVGPNDWNFLNALPMQNLSPFSYCLCFLSAFLPKKVRAPIYAMFALLSVGMLCAGILEIASYIPRNYAFHLILILGTTPHFLLSFFGIYLIRRQKINLSGKTMLWGYLLPIAIAIVMLIINCIFHTAYFGLSVYGDHNIYSVVISDYAAVSILAYFFGLCFVLAIGYLLQRFLVLRKTQS